MAAAALSSRAPSLGRLALHASAGATLVFILLPLVLVTWLAFFRQEIPAFPPEGYSVRWFPAILDNKSFVTGFLLSLKVGIGATAIGLLLALPASLVISRRSFRGRGAINTLLLMPLVVPGVVLGTAIYVGELELELATEWQLLGSTRLITASLAGMDPTIEEAAQNLGAGPWTTFRRITLPGIKPGLVAASLFGFVLSFGNLEVSLFLVGPGQTTLPIAILQYLAWKIDPTVAAVSVVQIVLVGGAMLVTDRYVKLARVV